MTGWRRPVLRTGLVLLALSNAGVGVWALFWPVSFFEDFPFGRGWVGLLPPYNEHLIGDVGGLNLVVAFGLAVSAVTLNPLLTRTSLIGLQLYAVPHLIFHAGHLEGFARSDAIAQTVLLALVVAVPLALLALTFGGAGPRAATPAGS